MIARSGYPVQAFDRMETWAAALTLLAVSFQQMGFKSDLGVEQALTTSYSKTKKPIVGLETVEQQLGFFDQLSEDGQRKLLVSIVDDPSAAQDEFQQMLQAWLSGDVDGIARTFDSETALSAELREVLMRKRNEAWASWIADRLDQPGTVFIAVGAGHLAGQDSVREMLEKRGIDAERLS
jgi:uncharacterized protein YbaP (TraB family)